MIKEIQVRLFDLVGCLSGALDMISPILVNHHKQVAYIALCLAREVQLPREEIHQIVLAGMFHDIGAMSFQERIDALQFEAEHPHRHAEMGYRLLNLFQPFAGVASLVRFHHVPWDCGQGEEFNGSAVPDGSHILHLADRIAVLVEPQKWVMEQADEIRRIIREQAGRMFKPELVEAFMSLADREYFWLDAVSPKVGDILRDRAGFDYVKLDTEGIMELANLFRRIIDFRSRFTATHSLGVAVVAEALAGLAGFVEWECKIMRVAGYLHDLGKLAIPNEILEKPGKLTPGEFNIVKSHAYFTYRTLETVENLEVINSWSSFHHERLDGTGYPFHLREEGLSLGSRIVAVADVFTAIMEDRPYRKGMEIADAMKVLNEMTERQALDGGIVSLLKDNFDKFNSVRVEGQENSLDEYSQLIEG